MHIAIGLISGQAGQKGKLNENIKFCLHCYLSLSSGLFQCESYKRHK